MEEQFPKQGQNKGMVLTPILLIEDDPFLWTLVRSKFIQEGFDVIIAKNGHEGIQKAQEGNIKLILLDIRLPDLDGFGVLEHLKRNDHTQAIPVVVLSNVGEPEDISKAMEYGVKDYLIKAHYTPQQIVEKVKSILGKA